MKVKQIIKVAEAIDDSRKMPCDMHELENTKYFSHSKQDFVTIADMDIVHLVRAFKNDRHRLANQITDDDLIKQNRDLVSANKTIGRKHDSWKEKAMNMVEKSSYDELQLENVRLVQQLEHDEHQVDKYDDLKRQTDVLVKDNSELRFQIQQVDRNQTVSKEAYDIAWDNNKILKNKYEELRKTYAVLLEDYNTDTGRGVWKERYEAELNNSEYWKNTYYNNQPKGCGYVFSEIPNDTDGQEFVDAMKKYFNKKSYKMRVRGQHIKPELKGTGATSHGQNIDESTHLRIYIEIK